MIYGSRGRQEERVRSQQSGDRASFGPFDGAEVNLETAALKEKRRSPSGIPQGPLLDDLFVVKGETVLVPYTIKNNVNFVP